MTKYYVNQDECIGCELCVELAPDVFTMKGNTAEAYKDDGEGAEEAYNSCPVDAIEKKEEV